MKRLLTTFFLAAIIALLPSGIISASDSCTDCHGDDVRMKDLGYPHFLVTTANSKEQTSMPTSCTDCHLGNAAAPKKQDAHQGLLTLRVVGKKWKTSARDAMNEQDLKDWPFLEPRGNKRASQLAPKRIVDGAVADNPDFRTILYHDKNPETLAFNPGIAEKTCGKCHPNQVKGFLKTAMGGGRGAQTQSQYVYWTSPTGPQSCGLWTGLLSQPDQTAFTDVNITAYNRHSTHSIPQDVAFNLQRSCNQCHVGCLDCHFSPQKKQSADLKQGAHRFVKKPDPLSCYGGGRSFSCHAGPLERRRGDGYLRGEFVQATAEGKKVLKDLPDVHAQKGLACTDCHQQNKKTGNHADLTRNVDCAACHARTVAAHTAGVHRKVDCSACHTALIGGYAFNFWTVGGEAGRENPITRIQDYQVDAIAPILVKNPDGIWIPVHVVPHTSGNVKASEVRISKRLLFRNRPDAAVDRKYRSNDSFAITGLVRDLNDTDHDTMVWLNVDRVAHGMGKSRSCASCHASTSQNVHTNFSEGSYPDVESGSYSIIADEKGLRVTDFKGPDNGPMEKGLVPFKDKWDLKGSFSLPKITRKALFQKLEKTYEAGKFEH